MDFTITQGISEAELATWLREAAIKFGTFTDGRVNYTDADSAPIVMCTVQCGDELLLVKRGYGLADAEGYWSTVNGFIDEVKAVKEQVKQEIREELGLHVTDKQVRVGTSYTVHNPKEKRRYIVFPCLVTVPTKPDIVLDRENTDFTWITRAELGSYDILADLPYAIDAARKA
jgi:NADH pyrophosphatase NudC (nudix superfamily)